MSAERMDHAAEARAILTNVQPDDMGEPGISDWLARAQVRATLALVEQQRIANLIALADKTMIIGAANGISTVEGVLRPEIREALGLS